ncbi:inversin-A [Nephila pilipes]|uniref:Inversin-A n=1 Tax=Nephila pilipes TaxID=299642 RepID=A0A8X6M5U2_NEPPI|nr:inversin-A [Nephila pilipes]
MELRRTNRSIHQRSLSPSHTSLMLACQQEAKEDVRSILERQPGAALQRDRTGKTALHYCAENVDVDCASRVLAAAPSLLNVADDEGYTPLHLAVISGNQSMVKYLLTKGADSRAVDSEKHSCVHWATVSGDLECLDLLINAGGDPSTPDIHGAYPVHYAAQMCGPNSEMGNDVRVGLLVLKKLLSRGVDVAVTDRDGRPPLLWAASGGSSDAILALVKMGADVNAVDQDGLTALHCAASRGHVDCLETLITLCGAQVDKVDESGCSALFYAVTLGHADCTNLLLTFGSLANRQDNKGRTPAHCGAAKGQLETLKILNHHKANLWMRNSKGDMPLHEAVQSGRKDLVEWLLLQHQGSVNVSNSNGRTPLHIAAITNNVDMCKVLMDYGAFINPVMKNSKNQLLTPLDAALHRGNRGCAKYLNLHGALPASKLLEKREYNRFTEAHLSNSSELSPNAKKSLVRDTSAQTELHLRDVDIQARVDLKSASASANLSRGPTPIGATYARKNFRCTAAEGAGKPIIAKVYVHTKRSKIRRMTRKPTAYRRDCLGEKLSVGTQHRPSVSFQDSDNRASTNVGEAETPQQTDHEKEVPSRKASQPVLYEERFQSVPEEIAEMEQIEDQEKIVEEEVADDRYDPEPDTGHYGPEPESGHCDQEPDIDQYDQTPGVDQYIQEPDDSHYDQEQVTGQNDQEESHHEEEANDDNPDKEEDRSQLLSVEQRRRSSLRTQEYDLENHSPLSSIRSLESTIKDSGFSDDVDRGHQPSSSEDDDDRGGYSDSENKYGRRRSRRHIARYVVSSGAAETFRLEEDDEEDKVVVKPRSSSLPHMRKKEEQFETCPRLLNRPTITKEVQRSLKKYQMERRLFYELQELKRKQITSSLLEEREVVQKMVDRFRNHVLSPYMSDFQGPLTFHAFEKYLYEQLRKLSMGGKIPKPKAVTKELPERIYFGTSSRKNSRRSRELCMCETHKCHHNTHVEDSGSRIPSLPHITKTAPIIKHKDFKSSVNRSKSWDRLDDAPRKNLTFGTCPGKMGTIQTSNSLPSLTNPFPRRVPAALLAAISERLGPDVHPEDTIVVEMSAENIASKMRHAFTVQELQEVVSRYEEQLGRKVKPIPLESVLDPDDDGPITFEIRHGKERNVFKLPAGKLKGNKKWFLHYCLWPTGRYFLPADRESLHIDDIQWEEIRLGPRAILMLPPNFWK